MEDINIQELKEKCNYFEVVCCTGEKYDFSNLEYNNIIDGQLRDLKINVGYHVVKVAHGKKKYDIDSDRVDEVTVITLLNKEEKIRIVAPYALIEHMEMIEDKIYPEDRLIIIRTDEQALEVILN